MGRKSCGLGLRRREINLKKCRICFVEKPFDMFSKRAKSKDGMQSFCRQCRSERYRENKDHVLKTHQEYRLANRGKERETEALYREKNREKLREKYLHFYYKNHDSNKEAMMLRQKQRPWIYQAHMAARRSRLKNATPKWVCLQEIRSLYRRATNLSIETGVKHHVDHIVPLTSRTVCGLHSLDNLQILTACENKSKYNSSWPDMP